VIGAELSLRARIDLAGLSTGDVVVQAVLGRVGPDDELTDTEVVDMDHLSTDAGTEQYAVTTPVPHSGAVGYTVRVLPRHPLLSGPAELGLVAAARP
jgi:starch phosphorylase